MSSKDSTRLFIVVVFAVLSFFVCVTIQGDPELKADWQALLNSFMFRSTEIIVFGSFMFYYLFSRLDKN